MPIRIVTKEVRYIHELSLTLEHSISVSSLNFMHKRSFCPQKHIVWSAAYPTQTYITAATLAEIELLWSHHPLPAVSE